MNKAGMRGRLFMQGLALACGLCLSSPALAMPAAGADLTSHKLRELQLQLLQQRQKSQKQINELARLRASLANLSQQQKTVFGKLDVLADNVARNENDLAGVVSRLGTAQRQLDATTKQRQLTEMRVETLKTDLRALMNASYREKNAHYLELLTQSSSLSDLVIRLNYAGQAGKHNLHALRVLKVNMAELEEQQLAQAQQTRLLKELRAQYSQKLEALRQTRLEQQQLLASLRSTEAGQRAIALRTKSQQALTAQSIEQLVSSVVKERQFLEAERQRRLAEERRRREAEARRIREAQERARQEAQRLARARADQARRAALAREQAALRERSQELEQQQIQDNLSSAPLPTFRGSHGFPLPGGAVAVPYGSGGARWAVLQGDQGAVAVAALEGNVLASTYYASLGWVVLIDNGSDVVTGYIGLQDTRVSVGERVGRGRAVGAIGGSPIFGSDRMAFQLLQNNVPVAPRF